MSWESNALDIRMRREMEGVDVDAVENDVVTAIGLQTEESLRDGGGWSKLIEEELNRRFPEVEPECSPETGIPTAAGFYRRMFWMQHVGRIREKAQRTSCERGATKTADLVEADTQDMGPAPDPIGGVPGARRWRCCGCKSVFTVDPEHHLNRGGPAGWKCGDCREMVAGPATVTVRVDVRSLLTGVPNPEEVEEYCGMLLAELGRQYPDAVRNVFPGSAASVEARDSDGARLHAVEAAVVTMADQVRLTWLQGFPGVFSVVQRNLVGSVLYRHHGLSRLAAETMAAEMRGRDQWPVEVVDAAATERRAFSVREATLRTAALFPGRDVCFTCEWWSYKDGTTRGAWVLSLLPGIRGESCSRHEGADPDACVALAQQILDEGTTGAADGIGES